MQNIYIWIRTLIKKNNIKAKIKNIYLLSFPRVLGYVFNPLSVYSCLDKNNKIILQIYEVHNTFNQRYFYLVKILLKKIIIKFIKKFHVSPFMSMSGKYRFKSYLNKEKIKLIVEYFSKTENFIASFSGRKKLTNYNLFIYFLKIPFMTIKIIVGIHFEAIILYLKGVKFLSVQIPIRSIL